MKYDDFGQCLVWNQERFDEDANIPDDVVTAKLVVEIANTIEDDITLTLTKPQCRWKNAGFGYETMVPGEFCATCVL